MQIGSQGMSSLGNEKAKQLYEDGAIGEIVMLDMYNDRYSADGAWQYAIPQMQILTRSISIRF